jgi:DNA replication protein DnaC
MNEFSPEDQKIVEGAQQRLLQRRKEVVITTGDLTPRQKRPVKQIGAAVASEVSKIELKISSTDVDRVQREAEEYERDQRRRKIASLWQKAGAPELHRTAKEWDKSSAWYKTLVGLREKISIGFLYALLGIRGNGKTQLGVEMIRSNSCLTRSSLYETTIRVYINIKSTFGKNSRLTEGDIIDQYTAPQLLVLDDYGRRGDGKHEENIFFEILDTRYRMHKDTIICSNENRKEFEAGAGESIISRINERGGIIECNWPSFREQQPQI